jgi:NADPH:quinone reductase-like Zn-dependent oxidoreductase
MGPNVAKALRFAEFGSPSVLRIEELAIPEPAEGEALVHVKAAAINPSDIGNVAGHFKNTTLARTPGRDFAGIVVFNTVGGPMFGPALRSLRFGGRQVAISAGAQLRLAGRTERKLRGWSDGLKGVWK